MTTVSEVFGAPRWTDGHFRLDDKLNIIRPDQKKIFRHGIETSSALWQAHLVLCEGIFLAYRTADMRKAIQNIGVFPNQRAFYTPSYPPKFPTARGFLFRIGEIVTCFEHKILPVPEAALWQIKKLKRYDAGRYAEKRAFPASCKMNNLSWARAAGAEDREFGIDCYVDGETWQIKLDTPNSGNIFIQTHTNNFDNWWGANLSATNENTEISPSP